MKLVCGPLAREPYGVLGLEPGASTALVRQAYLDLAKEWHPDLNPSPHAPAKFDEIHRAYRALDRTRSGSESLRHRTNADWLQGPGKTLKPLRCSRCRQVTAQPRHTSYSTIISFLVLSKRFHHRGVFCAPCGRSIGFKASAIAGLLGWWSIPGLILTPLTILKNASGGDVDYDINVRLLFYNLLAFEYEGDGHAAAEMARVLTASPRTMPLDVSFITDSILRRTLPSSHPAANPWQPRWTNQLMHAMCACSTPLAVIWAFLSR